MIAIKKRYKAYLKLNVVSIIFIATSFIFTTLAWFAYSGMSNVSTEMEVKAWYIELTRKGQKSSNEVSITLDDLYPGMETINEVINIKNLGDSNAYVNYKIESVRILDEFDYKVDDKKILSSTVEDDLSHTYPFHINVNLEKRYLLSQADGDITVSVSWPLESGNDELDSDWGNKAYSFKDNEAKKEDKNYKARPSIQIVLKITAEQYINEHEETILNFGDTILYDVENDARCYELRNGCIKTTLLDEDIERVDKVRLLPNLLNEYPKVSYENYETTYEIFVEKWKVGHRELLVDDLVKVISKDINNSYIVGNELSNIVIGTINNEDRLTSIINNTKLTNRYYQFNNSAFEFLVSNKCFWTNSKIDDNNVYSLKKIDDNISKIYPTTYPVLTEEEKCYIIPIIEIDKNKLNYTLYE